MRATNPLYTPSLLFMPGIKTDTRRSNPQNLSITSIALLEIRILFGKFGLEVTIPELPEYLEIIISTQEKKNYVVIYSFATEMLYILLSFPVMLSKWCRTVPKCCKNDVQAWPFAVTFLHCCVFRVYPNLNLKFQAPELSSSLDKFWVSILKPEIFLTRVSQPTLSSKPNTRLTYDLISVPVNFVDE